MTPTDTPALTREQVERYVRAPLCTSDHVIEKRTLARFALTLMDECDALKAESVILQRKCNAQTTLISCKEQSEATYRKLYERDRFDERRLQSLESEKEMNSLLTEENARLKTELDANKSTLTAERDAARREAEKLAEALVAAKYAIKGREHTGFIDKALAAYNTTKPVKDNSHE